MFYNPNNEGIDEIIGKASSDCSYRYMYSYEPLRLIYNIKIIDLKKKKTKNKVIKDIPIGMMSFIRKMKQKQRYKLIKTKK